MRSPNSVVLYHAQCTDGFGAAYSAYRRLKNRATYHPIYHSLYEDIAWQDWLIETCTNKHVFILDIALPADLLCQVGDTAKSVEIHDHHASTIKELANFQHDKVLLHLDASRSGAALAWNRFHRTEEIDPGNEMLPNIIQYIQDYDLWVKKLPNIEEVAIYLHSLPYEFNRWDETYKLMIGTDDGLDIVTELGRAMLRYRDSNVERAVKHVFMTKWNGQDIPTVNSCLQVNEICVWLLANYPNAPFAAVYYDETAKSRKWSMRSRKGQQVDVSQIGKAITPTGGGHPNSAGFTQHLMKPIIPEFKW